jgi:hypothetical protein
MNRRAWARLMFENRRTIFALTKEGFAKWRASRRRKAEVGGGVAAQTAGSSGD